MRSILMTSAPRRASTWAQRGPAWWRPRSITRMPESGPLPSVIALLLGSPVRSEDDHEPAARAAGGHLALGLRRALGRKRFRHAQGEPSFGDQAPQPIERFVILHVRGDPHRLDGDAALRRAGEAAYRGELAVVADGRQRSSVEHGG